MDPDDGLEEEEGPYLPWVPPDDRLWRHPSEAPTSFHDDPADPQRQRAHVEVATLAGPPPESQAARLWAVALVAGIVGALAASGVAMMSGSFDQKTTVVHSVMGSSSAVSLASSTAAGVNWAAINDAVAPSVVAIDVSGPNGTVSGSGVMFIPGGKDTYVITDYGLVSTGGSALVTFPSGAQATAVVVGEDAVTSLALLAVPDPKADYPTLGSVAELQVASSVMAMGARTPLGGSVFPGSVSAQDREVDLADGSSMQDLVAISSPSVPPTATGGPLVDQQGRVVGILVNLQPTDTADQGLSFAVPVDVAEHVAQEILSGGPITHPWLGVTNAVDISTTVAHQFGLEGGAQVGDVTPDSPASRIGLASRDIITALNGLPVTSSGTLVQQMFGHCLPGTAATISYLHQGKPAQATFYVTNQPDGS